MSYLRSIALCVGKLRNCLQRLRAHATRLERACRRGPFTIQTYAIAGFCAYLLVGPVPRSADIVSASLAWGLLVIVALIALSTLAHALRTKKRLTLEITPPSGEILAQKSAQCVVCIPPLSLLPGSFLECSLLFTQAGETADRVRLYGSWTDERRVVIKCSFPHRGAWEICGIRCAVGDMTGFVRMAWNILHQSTVVVAPTLPHNTALPLISSTQRPGDLVPDAINRHGDPYDIKRYHPSDGIKKIVWKAFAKSGELLSRHPEPSMTPEGFVAICILARPYDDDVCGKALAYLQALEELDLDMLVGCEGLNGRQLATTPESGKTLTIDCVWDSDRSNSASLITDVQSVVDACVNGTNVITLRKIILFCAGSRFSTSKDIEQITALGAWLTEKGIEPVFFLTEPRKLEISSTPQLRMRLNSLLLSPLDSEHLAQPAKLYKEFLSICIQRQWEIFV